MWVTLIASSTNIHVGNVGIIAVILVMWAISYYLQVVAVVY